MKKIISMFTLVATVLTMCSFSVFADYASTLTMSTSAVDNKANVGDEFVVSATLGTSNGLKTLGFKIVFDTDDIELGVAPTAKEYYMNPEYESMIGTEYATWEALTKDGCGHYSYVDDTYYNTYKGYDTKKIGDATIGYEVKESKGYVAFGYALDTAIGSLKKVTNMLVGGTVLKVKTDKAKQTTITILEATASGSDGVDTPCTIANTITLNLNGYTGEDDDTVTKVEDTTDKGITAYTVSSLADKKIMTKTFSNVAVKAGMGLIVTRNGETREFGGDLYEALGSPAEGTVTIGSLAFGLVVDDDATASQFTFELR